MSNKVCRGYKDLGATGHGCTSRIATRYSQRSVFVNGIEMSRDGDRALPHTIKVGRRCVGHSAKINEGSRSVFCQSIAVARVGDSFDRGKMIQGSPNVFAGD